LTTSGGTAPSLVEPPTGCRFAPRCPHAMAVCTAEAPPAVEVAPGQRAACWLHVSVGRRPTAVATGNGQAAAPGAPPRGQL
jgi:peptide/nickel transport system ATP-binding protein